MSRTEGSGIQSPDLTPSALTNRELEVFVRLAQGNSNKGLASILGVSYPILSYVLKSEHYKERMSVSIRGEWPKYAMLLS
jgi:FixJ family two-component response regulator